MRVLIACGASGGHVFPALTFAANLKAEYPGSRILFLSTPRCLGEISCAGYPVSALKALRSFSNPLARICAVTLVTLTNFLLSAAAVLRFNPGIVVGFGSYSSVPVMFLASLLGKKTILHEQNVLPGLSTRMLLPFVSRLAAGFPETAANISGCFRHKVIFTGNPVRKELIAGVRKDDALRFFGLDTGMRTVLVLGGSQGSRRINEVFLESAGLLKKDLAFQVIHIAGKTASSDIRLAYDTAGIKARVFDFLREMVYAYCAADIVVSRAGAMSVAEIIALAKPAVLIPYPYAREHQLKNAEVLGKKEAAVVIREVDLNPLTLKENILSVLAGSSDKFKANLERMRIIGSDRLFLEAVVSLVGK